MLFVLPLVTNKRLPGAIVTGSLLWVTLVTFTLAWFIDPGYIKSDPKIDFQELLIKTDPYNLWPDWKIIRTPRSRHWNICNKWVERFDHHCPYLNNWIGYRNHWWFLLFIFSLTLNLAYHWALCIYTLIIGNPKEDWWDFIKEYYPEYFFYGYISILLGIALVFLPFVTILSWVHSRNFWMNKTTNERYSRK